MNTTTRRRLTMLLFAIAGVVMALGEAAWHSARPSPGPAVTALSAETARIQAITAELAAHKARIVDEMNAMLERSTSEADRARIRTRAAQMMSRALLQARIQADAPQRLDLELTDALP